MPGSPAMPSAADPPPGARRALVVATGTYDDAGLRRLRAPARDADDLAQVLADPDIGGFTVTTVIDQPAQRIRLTVEDFLDGRGTGDLLLVYLSCHGLLDARRRLYFAATDTRKDRLGATGVDAAWVLDQLEHCRARRQVLILDCCFSGAFAHDAKREADVSLQDRFLGHGRGRVVLTASTATEYSFEGDPTDAAITPTRSVFTAALVRGLRTGAADTDRDGQVSVDDAYAYVFDQVQAAGAAQTPQRWLYGAEGQILLARSPAGPMIIPAPLPDSLRAGLDSPYPGVRIGAVTELGEWLTGGDPASAATARRHLQEVADTDIPGVAQTARALLDTGTTDEPSAPAVLQAAQAAPSHPQDLVGAYAESSRATPRRIFVSYRREDTAYPAAWLYDRLAERFGRGQVFKDVDSIDPGDDFVEVITTAVGSCDVLLALIGDRWLTTTDAAGSRRIDDTDDFVRLEIEAALARNIRVVPILVGGARMPRADDLPTSLAKLARRQALELSPNRFDSDLSRLFKVLEQQGKPGR